MQSKLNPYINFKGDTREAMEFYQTVFGGKLDLTTFKEGGMPGDPSNDEKIMHGMLVAENGITLMGSDMSGSVDIQAGNNMSVSLSGDNEAELKAYFEKLSAGGTVREPLFKAPWGDTFGALTDKFGVAWMVNIAGQKA